jgi:dTDP-D-glucose 4,6-dehydratase
MRLLVTGAAGFTGSNFVRRRLEAHPGDHVVALGLLTYAGDRRNLAGFDVRLVEGDICDLELVERVPADEEIEVVVNFAADSHNSLAVLDPGHLLDSSKLRRELAWQPEVSFEDGLRATVEWYAANRTWWEPLRERAPVSETAWR